MRGVVVVTGIGANVRVSVSVTDDLEKTLHAVLFGRAGGPAAATWRVLVRGRVGGRDGRCKIEREQALTA